MRRVTNVTFIVSLPSRPLIVTFSTLLLLVLLSPITFSSFASITSEPTIFANPMHQAWAFSASSDGNQTGISPLSTAPSSSNTTPTLPVLSENPNQTSSTNATIPEQEISEGNTSLLEDGIATPTGNNPPEAHDMIIQRQDTSAVAFELNGTDADIDDRLTFVITLNPQAGNISSFDSSAGFVVYTPATNFPGVGSDFFRYMVIDSSGAGSDNATVSVQFCPAVADC